MKLGHQIVKGPLILLAYQISSDHPVCAKHGAELWRLKSIKILLFALRYLWSMNTIVVSEIEFQPKKIG